METSHTVAEQLLGLLADYLVRLPAVLVWVVGVILCTALWRRNPRGTPLAMLAMAGLLVLTLIMPVVYWLINTAAQQEDSSLGEHAELWYRVAAFVEGCGEATAWVLVLTAVFARRPEPGRLPPPPDVRPVDDPPPAPTGDPPPSTSTTSRRP
jgi:hypothetical protein